MNRHQKFLIHFMAIAFIAFIMVFSMNTWCLISGFKDFFEDGQNIELTAFVYDGVQENDIQNFIKKYESNPIVSKISRQSPEESFKDLKAELKLFDFQIPTAELSKVLPQIITLRLNSFDTNLVSEIKANKIVDELIDGKQWLEKNENIISMLAGAIAFVVVICTASLILSLALLLNTQLQFEKDEIHLRAMHGEPLWRLRKVYVYKGILLALGGTILGILSTYFGTSIMRQRVFTQFQTQTLAKGISPLPITTSIVLILAAACIGGLVAYFQTRVFKKEFYLQK